VKTDDHHPHCTAVRRDEAYHSYADCTCGWRSPHVFIKDAESYAMYHRYSVGETIDNPYLHAFLDPVTDAEIELVSRSSDGLSRHLADHLALMLRRDRLTAQYAWAIPTENVVRRIADLSPICDLGCGTGYWAKLLSDIGARVIAVDSSPPLTGNNHWHRQETGLYRQPVQIQHFIDIVPCDARTYDVPADHALMLCWPPFGDDMAAVALDRYRGDNVVYIGEHDGCTGDEKFHEALAERWQLTACYEIPQWNGLHDDVHVYRRAT